MSILFGRNVDESLGIQNDTMLKCVNGCNSVHNNIREMQSEIEMEKPREKADRPHTSLTRKEGKILSKYLSVLE